MSTQPKPYLTPEQYLEIERAAEHKSEYFSGEMFAMAGTTLAHAIINFNVAFALRMRLSGSDCSVVLNDLRLRVPKTGLYTYPDILVICGEPQLVDDRKDMVSNPTVIVEILSPSTQNYDRGDKFAHYRTMPSLRDYLLVAQDRMHAEHYVLQPDGGWLLHEMSDGEAILSLNSIGVQFKLAEAYARVQF